MELVNHRSPSGSIVGTAAEEATFGEDVDSWNDARRTGRPSGFGPACSGPPTGRGREPTARRRRRRGLGQPWRAVENSRRSSGARSSRRDASKRSTRRSSGVGVRCASLLGVKAWPAASCRRSHPKPPSKPRVSRGILGPMLSHERCNQHQVAKSLSRHILCLRRGSPPAAPKDGDLRRIRQTARLAPAAARQATAVLATRGDPPRQRACSSVGEASAPHPASQALGPLVR